MFVAMGTFSRSKKTQTVKKAQGTCLFLEKQAILPGGSPASRSHPRSRPGRDRAAAARSSRGLLQPWSCDRGESSLGCPCSPATHPGPTASDRVGRKPPHFQYTTWRSHRPSNLKLFIPSKQVNRTTICDAHRVYSKYHICCTFQQRAFKTLQAAFSRSSIAANVNVTTATRGRRRVTAVS